jgi:hypothetical protein
MNREVPTPASDALVPIRNPIVSRLVVLGALLAVGGLIAALALKESADSVAAVATSSTRLVSDGTLIGLTFAPHAAPNYMGLWIAGTVTVIGLMVVLSAIIVAATTRRAA